MFRSDRPLSRRRFLGFSAAAAAGLALAGCETEETGPMATAEPGQDSDPGSPEPATPPAAENATLDERIAEMLMAGFRGFTLDPADSLASRLKVGLLGNVVLFDYDLPSGGQTARNVKSPEQLASLTEQLRGAAPRRLLIATDQEGGKVARLSTKHGFPWSYSPQDLGARNDAAFTRQASNAMARTLFQSGINLNLAPVLDLNVNASNPIIGQLGRSFGADAYTVTKQALAFIQGHHDAGVLTTLKHFPGHGSSKDDSHLGFVDVTGLWSRKELEPFRNVIQSGTADAIMTAHIFNSEWDAEHPATLSKAVITGILRDELGFKGVVITDDMQMGAIRLHYGFEFAIEMAINAGSDIIALSNNGDSYDPNLAEKAFMAIRRAVTSGRITEARINESYERITELKSRLG